MIRAALRCLALLVVLTASAAPAPAQAQTVDYALWSNVAERAEASVDAAEDSDETYEVLRARIAKFRQEFDVARRANDDRIASMRAQLEALGPAPKTDADEPEAADIAAKRAELEASLARLTAPAQRAEAAYRRADGLIGEIDSILRDRQTSKLLAVTASPLNPTNWGGAIAETQDAFASLSTPDTTSAREARWGTFRQNIPVVALAGAFGLLLIFRGRSTAGLLVQRIAQRGRRYNAIWRFLLSLLRIVLPLLGLILLSVAAVTTGYLGPRGNELATMVPFLGAFVLGFRWVADRVFSRDDEEALLPLPEHTRRSARFWVGAITFVLAIAGTLEFVLQLDDAPSDVTAIVTFPLTLLMGFFLYRFGRILRSVGDDADADEADGLPSRAGTLGRVVRGLGLGAIVVAIAAPLLQAAGYDNARAALMPPYILTLALFGLVLAVQRFAADVYGAITGQGVAARDALMPILFGMILLLLATPVLALIWGARLSDLTELWTSFTRGFSIGESRISPTDFIAFAAIFGIGYVLTRLLQGALRSNVLPKTKLDVGGQNAIVSGLGYVGIFLAALAAITGAGIDLSSIAIVAGALSVGIGFGLQNIVSNFVSGIILLIERPISEGDWIEVGGQMGYVRDISVRSTRIETFDRTDVIVPNADLVSGSVTNYTRGNTVGRVIIAVGVAYGTDTRQVEGILRKIAEAHPMVLINPAPSVVFMSFGADALEFEVRCFLRDVNWMLSVKSEINHEIAKRFAEEGIEIPFAQRDLWLRNPETLRQEDT